MARLGSWIEPFPEGIYVKPADAWVDPSRPKVQALVTHGHADHARGGHGAVWATPETLAIMETRYGEQAGRPISYGDSVRIGEVDVSFVPAGHVLGSAQIVLEYRGERVVVSGDYKRRPDPTCAPFVVVPCDIFITEATFGLPVFRHPDTGSEIDRLLHRLHAEPERCVLVGAYALGKAQRVITELRRRGHDQPIYYHGAVERLCNLYEELGVPLGEMRHAAGDDRKPRQVRLQGGGRHRPVIRLRRPLGPALQRAAAGLRLRLDDGAAACQTARRRTAARHLRSLRLAGTDRNHPGTAPGRGLGDAWPRGGAGALVPIAGHQGKTAASGGL